MLSYRNIISRDNIIYVKISKKKMEKNGIINSLFLEKHLSNALTQVINAVVNNIVLSLAINRRSLNCCESVTKTLMLKGNQPLEDARRASSCKRKRELR